MLCIKIWVTARYLEYEAKLVGLIELFYPKPIKVENPERPAPIKKPIQVFFSPIIKTTVILPFVYKFVQVDRLDITVADKL